MKRVGFIVSMLLTGVILLTGCGNNIKTELQVADEELAKLRELYQIEIKKERERGMNGSKKDMSESESKSDDIEGNEVKFSTQQEDFVKVKFRDINEKDRKSGGYQLNDGIVYISLGERPTGGYSINIDNITKEENKIIIKVSEKKPEEGSTVTLSLTVVDTYVILDEENLEEYDIEVVSESEKLDEI